MADGTFRGVSAYRLSVSATKRACRWMPTNDADRLGTVPRGRAARSRAKRRSRSAAPLEGAALPRDNLFKCVVIRRHPPTVSAVDCDAKRWSVCVRSSRYGLRIFRWLKFASFASCAADPPHFLGRRSWSIENSLTGCGELSEIAPRDSLRTCLAKKATDADGLRSEQNAEHGRCGRSSWSPAVHTLGMA